MDRRYREGNEVAQPVAGTFLSPRLCWNWCPLFSALGHPEAFRNYCSFLGESLSLLSHAPTRGYAAGASTRLNLDSMPHAALLMNYSKDFAAPDQAAAATAIATGERVANRAVAINADGKAINSIIELAREYGMGHGTHNGHEAHRSDQRGLLRTSRRVERCREDRNRVCGSRKCRHSDGWRRCTISSRHKRAAIDRTAVIFYSSSVAMGLILFKPEPSWTWFPAWRRPKLVGVFSKEDLAFVNQVKERSQQPSLSDMVRRAIQLLQYNVGGYLLVVDAGLMRKAAQENNGERTLSQTVELDRAVGIARSYGGEKSTIVVCGDVAIGGLNLNGFPFLKDSGIALLGFNSAGQPGLPGPPVRMAINRTEQRKYQVNKTKIRPGNRRRNNLNRRRFTRNLLW